MHMEVFILDDIIINEVKPPSQDDRTMGMFIYLISFFTAIIGPLIIWIIKKDDSEFVDFHGKEYFNFFISYTVYIFIGSLLMIILIGFIIVPILAIMYFVFTLIALFKAYNGEHYRIPLIFRFIK